MMVAVRLKRAGTTGVGTVSASAAGAVPFSTVAVLSLGTGSASFAVTAAVSVRGSELVGVTVMVTVAVACVTRDAAKHGKNRLEAPH